MQLSYVRFDRSMMSAPTYVQSMAEYLHTMLRITGPEKSRAFYEALGFELRASRGHAPAGSFRWSA
jgi:hypothetical protein